jgi:PST family polysaccharide transporter
MRRDAFWSALEAVVSAVLSVAASFAVARLIGPSELGIGAAAAAVHVVLWVAVNALFADALVQRPDVDQRALSTAFWASLAIGCSAMLVQAAAGAALGEAMDDPRLLPMALVLALPLPLVGAAATAQGMLTRQRDYRRIALRTLIGQGAGTATGIAAALGGAGAWAPVLQQAVTSGLGALVLLAASGRMPCRAFERAALGGLLRVGLPLTASTLVQIGRYRLFAVLIGAAAGPAVLGQVHIAFRLVDTVRELAFTALWRLMLPEMARAQADQPRLLALVDRWQRRCLLVMLPLCAGLAVGLAQLVAFAMGPQWQQAGRAALPLVALTAVMAAMYPSGVALVARGGARFALYANLGSMALACGGAVLLRLADPWQAVALWVAAQLAVAPYVLWACGRALGVGALRPLAGGFRVSASP